MYNFNHYPFINMHQKWLLGDNRTLKEITKKVWFWWRKKNGIRSCDNGEKRMLVRETLALSRGSWPRSGKKHFICFIEAVLIYLEHYWRKIVVNSRVSFDIIVHHRTHMLDISKYNISFQPYNHTLFQNTVKYSTPLPSL